MSPSSTSPKLSMKHFTDDQEKELVEFVIEDFGTELNRDDFIGATLEMFDDIAGLEAIDGLSLSMLTNKLWRLYCDHK